MRRNKPDGQIEAFLDEIDHAACHGDPERCLGIERQELSHGSGKYGRQGLSEVKPQEAARICLRRLCDLVGLIDLGQDLDATLVIGLPDFRETDLTRAPVEEQNPETILKRLDVRGHDARRDIEASGRRREPGAFDHFDERVHGCQAVHARHPPCSDCRCEDNPDRNGARLFEMWRCDDVRLFSGLIRTGISFFHTVE